MDTGLVIPIVSWYLVLGALALVGLPIALFLFKHLPDCGYAFSRALGLLFIGYIAWLLTILGFARFNYNLLLFLVFCIGALGWFIVLSQPRDLARLRTRWRNILGYEALFLIAFLFIVWLRSYDPHPQGTERPMDYALYNAVMQSQTFPPHDPWLSGYAINYYYFGYLLMSVPTLLSRSDPAIGYNLSLATLFALTAVHVAALINTLIALNREKQNTSSRRTLLDAVLPLLGIFLVLIVGNQAGALQVLTGTEKVVAFDAQQTWAAILNRLEGAKDTLYLPYPTPLTSDFGTLQDVKLGDAWSDFNWWWPSRALWDDIAISGELHRVYNITEFPFFSFYLGDMHPHVLALPFTLLVAASALGLMARGEVPQWWNRNAIDRFLVAAYAVLLGSLYFLNSWDLPSYALLLILAMVWVQKHPLRANERKTWRSWIIKVSTLLLASILCYLPFFLTFRSFAGFSTLPAVLERVPVLRTIASLVGIVFWSKSSIHQVFAIFGLFAVPVIGYLIVKRRRIVLATKLESPQLDLGRLAHFAQSHTAWGWTIVITFIMGSFLNFPLLVLLPVAVYAFTLSLYTSEVATAFTLMGIALASFILVAADIFFIPDVFGNRMNTVFKFYYQVWALGGILAAYALWALLWQSSRRILVQVITLCLFGILLIGAMVYPARAIQQRMNGAQQGVRGFTAREMRNVGEREAITWLTTHSAPNSVMVEAVGESYDATGTGGGGISGATGLQTVLGWPGHETQWRHNDPSALSEIGKRKTDIQTIYTSRNAQQVLDLLDLYNIRYVVVGETEHQTYRNLNPRLFERIMRKAFVSSDGKLLIFERLNSST